MKHRHLINRWLSEIPDSPRATSPEWQSKHKEKPELCKRPLPSSPRSMSVSSSQGSPSKRQRTHYDDPDATPTRDNISQSLHDLDSVSEQMSTTSSMSYKSRQPSPTKGLATLRNEHILDYQTFSGRTAPPAELHEVFQQIKRLGTGQGILSPEDADAIRNTDLDVGGFKHMISEPVAAATYTSETRRDLGTLPSLEKLINDVWENAIRCERHDLPEAAWNCAVHYPLLQETLRCTQLRQANLSSQQVRLKADNITSINITKLYAPSTARLKHNKRVDFCLYFDPDEGSPLADAIYDKVKFNIHPSVNHTELPYLSRSPIAMGIETKKTGEGWRAALEQISIWASAHWKRLRELTEDTDKLPFLPAIIVQGHDWFFVAATQGRVLKGGNRETVIWSKAPIGGTEGLEGICQLVAVLQYLAKWSVETYWPWFCQAVLGQT